MFGINFSSQKVYPFAALFAFTALTAFAPVCSEAATQATYYVSPGGSDANPGTLALPFQTITKARDIIRTIGRPLTGDIFVYLRCGTYYLAVPIQFGVSDGGGNGFTITYMPYNKETVVIDGGEKVTGWTAMGNNKYRATLNRTTKLRGLFVNGVKAEMTAKVAQPTGTSGTFTIAGTEPWAQTSGSSFDALTFNATALPSYENPGDVELEWHWQWNSNMACVRNMTTVGSVTTVAMQQPEGAIASKLAWAPLAWKDNWGRIYNISVRNAYELLTTPGQFYFNKTTKVLYYYSRGENMATANVIAPLSEGLIRIYGTSTTNRVKALRFYGMTFMHDHFLLYNVGGSRGMAGSQSTAVYYKFREDGSHCRSIQYTNEDLPQATIGLRNCDSIKIDSCRFIHLGSAIAINLENDVRNTSVIGNVFKDLSGNAVSIAHPQHWAIGDGPLSPFPPGIEGLCQNNIVKNNFIRNISTEFTREEAIVGYHLNGLEVSHNDIQYTPYGSISVGWYWGATCSSMPASTVMGNIKINYNVCGNDHLFLIDGGTIYTMNNSPNSEIFGNYTIKGTWSIMPDEGAGAWAIKNNVIDKAADLWLQIWHSSCHDLVLDNNYTNQSGLVNAGTRCVITNTHNETAAPPWSAGAQAIINAAGIEASYRKIMADTLQPAPCPEVTVYSNNVEVPQCFSVRIFGHRIELPGEFAGKPFSADIFDLHGRVIQKISFDKNQPLKPCGQKVSGNATCIVKCKSGKKVVSRRVVFVRQ